MKNASMLKTTPDPIRLSVLGFIKPDAAKGEISNQSIWISIRTEEFSCVLRAKKKKKKKKKRKGQRERRRGG